MATAVAGYGKRHQRLYVLGGPIDRHRKNAAGTIDTGTTILAFMRQLQTQAGLDTMHVLALDNNNSSTETKLLLRFICARVYAWLKLGDLP